MPRYHYRCSECNTAVTIIHSIDDVHSQCEFCEKKDTMIKLLTKPIIVRNDQESNSEHTVGKITNEYIEENRKILKQIKRELKEDEPN